MADTSRYSIDISALWGPDGEGVVGGAAATLNGDDYLADLAPNGRDREPVDRQRDEDVIQVAEAVAGNHSDLLRRADLDAMRADLERAFTQQIAVALYELLTACNVRFASAEEHINGQLAAAVEAQTRQLAESLEATFYAAVDVGELVRSQLGAVREELARPDEDLRQEIGRLSELVEKQVAELSFLRLQISEMRSEMEARPQKGVSVQNP